MAEEINRRIAIDNGDSKVARSFTEKPPAHFTLKINSFTSLYKTMMGARDETFESEVFEAGGYKWRMSLYPNGDKGNKGKGYISIYVVIVDTHDLPHDWEVIANLKFFVYDQFKNKYLTVQDANATASKFDGKNIGFGFARLLPYSSFLYTGNGYRVGDKCKFGVEVIVQNYKGKDCRRTVDTLAIVNGPFTWKINEFSSHSKECYPSDVFTVGNRNWNLKIYPKGEPSMLKDTMLSVFLEAEDLKISPEQKTFVILELRMVNQRGWNDVHIKSLGFCFSKRSPCLGCSAFFPLADLHDASKGFLVNDTLILIAKVYVFSTVRTFSKKTHIPAPNADKLLQTKVQNQWLKKNKVMNFSGIFHTGAAKGSKPSQAKAKQEVLTQTEGNSLCSSEKCGVEAPKAIQSRRPWWFFA